MSRFRQASWDLIVGSLLLRAPPVCPHSLFYAQGPVSSFLQVCPPAHPKHSARSPRLPPRPSISSPPFLSTILSLPSVTQFHSLPSHLFLSTRVLCWLPNTTHNLWHLSDGEIATSQQHFLSSIMLFSLPSCGSQFRGVNEPVLLVLRHQGQNCRHSQLCLGALFLISGSETDSRVDHRGASDESQVGVTSTQDTMWSPSVKWNE